MFLKQFVIKKKVVFKEQNKTLFVLNFILIYKGQLMGNKTDVCLNSDPAATAAATTTDMLFTLRQMGDKASETKKK